MSAGATYDPLAVSGADPRHGVVDVDAVKSDAADLAYFGPLYVGVAGNVKFTDVRGNIMTKYLVPGWHPFFVRRVWSTGTAATDLMVAY